MARKAKDYETQREKFLKTARKLGIDENNDDAFQSALRQINKARKAAPKNAARKSKG